MTVYKFLWHQLKNFFFVAGISSFAYGVAEAFNLNGLNAALIFGGLATTLLSFLMVTKDTNNAQSEK